MIRGEHTRGTSSGGGGGSTKVGAMVFNQEKQAWERADGTTTDDEMADFDRLLDDEEDEEDGFSPAGFSPETERQANNTASSASDMGTMQTPMHQGRESQKQERASAVGPNDIPGADSEEEEDWDEVVESSGILPSSNVKVQADQIMRSNDFEEEDYNDKEGLGSLDQFQEDDENWDKLASGQGNEYNSNPNDQLPVSSDEEEEDPFHLDLRELKYMEKEAHEATHFLSSLPKRTHRTQNVTTDVTASRFSGIMQSPSHSTHRSSSTMRPRQRAQTRSTGSSEMSNVLDDTGTRHTVKTPLKRKKRELQKLLHYLEAESKQLARARMVANSRRLQYLQNRVQSLQEQFS
eukprot:gb/GECG01004283.1/.p1 GENE.gb/GECG01004283.1/~~gb/GECG01004283.1/.p1  ORF type:complete len:349 (+),score=80.43 gb/GECG01004283.1/:1-1047(+)